MFVKTCVLYDMVYLFGIPFCKSLCLAYVRKESCLDGSDGGTGCI